MDDEQRTTTMPPVAPRHRWRMVIAGAVLLMLVAGVAVGGFFVGQNTRKSDGEVAALTSAAVTAETKRQEDIRRKALEERKAADKRNLRRVVKKIKAAAKREAEQSYAAGQSVGYSSGHSAGEEEGEEEGYIAGSVQGYDAGLTDASDALDCSDDPDVYWLPPCY